MKGGSVDLEEKKKGGGGGYELAFKLWVVPAKKLYLGLGAAAFPET